MVLRKEGSITCTQKDTTNFALLEEGRLTSKESYTYLMSSFKLLS